jgi:hypothetical protein
MAIPNLQVNTALDSLPFVKDTMRLRQRDTQLVQQLADLNQARVRVRVRVGVRARVRVNSCSSSPTYPYPYPYPYP